MKKQMVKSIITQRTWIELSKSYSLAVFRFSFLSILSFFSCADEEQSLDHQISLLNLQTLPEVIHPTNNPTTEAKVELGRLLFYDPIISGQRDISCYSCHLPAYGYAEPLDLSRGPGGTGVGKDRVGGRDVTRNSTGVIYSAYVGLRDAHQQYDPLLAAMTWTINNRALEPQAMAGAMINPTHMRGSGSYDATSVGDSMALRLKKIIEYVNLFDHAFGGGSSSVSGPNIGKALGAFQRSLAVTSSRSPYDHYVNGNLTALTEQQKEGLLLFYGKANCANCHGGPMFSDFALYNLGVKDHSRVSPLDMGAKQQRLFKTPTLRNVKLTAPYMHNGTISTLQEVLEFYNNGIPENPSVNQNELSIKIKPLHLSDVEMKALLSFLEALTDVSYDMVIPTSVPSGLPVGGN